MAGELNKDALEALVADEGAKAREAEEQAAEEAEFEAGFNGRTEGDDDPQGDADNGEAGDDGEDDGDEPLAAKNAPVDDERYTKLEHRLRAVEGRNGTLIAQNKELSKRIESLTAVPQPTVTQMVEAAMVGGAKLKSLQDEFPEFAEALDEQSKAFSASVDTRLEAMKAEYSGRVTKEEAREMAKEARQLAQIDFKYPGWEETCQTAEFTTWYQQQDDNVKALAHSDATRDALELLDRFARDNKLTGSDGISVNKLTHNPKDDTTASSARLRAAIPATSSASRSGGRQSSEEEDFLAGYKSVRG